jgi:hypothetical protein
VRESIETTSVDLDVLSNIKRINSHLTAVAYPILEYGGFMPCRRASSLASGDTGTPTAAFACTLQMRKWTTRKAAMGVAMRLLRENQLACFDVEGRRPTIQSQLNRAARSISPTDREDVPGGDSAHPGRS